MNQPICKHDRLLKEVSECKINTITGYGQLPRKWVQVNIPAALWSAIRNYVKERSL